MIYFTSDLHFGHTNLIKKGSRPQFEKVETMDQTLIKNWNDVVDENDEVYIVGDFCFLSLFPAEFYLGVLKGKKHLIIGNHDAEWLKKMKYPEKYFSSVRDIAFLQDKEKQITLCHYPWMEWPGCRGTHSKPGYMIHGHIHGNKDHRSYKLIKENKMERILNCSVDINGFRPVTLEELIINNEKWYNED